MPRSTRARVRAFAVVAAVTVAMAACDGGGPQDDTGAPETEPPTASPEVQSAGTFQLSGVVEHAFQGVGPPVQVSLAGVSLSPSPDVPATASPAAATATPAAGTPTQQGVMRVTLDNVSTELRSRCAANAGDRMNVFWLTDSQFDTSLLTGTTLEGSLDGRRVGVAGSIFLTAGQQTQPDFALPSPTVTPASTPVGTPVGTPGALNTNCTLVADRITTATEGETLPTVRPRARVTARPTVRPTRTPVRTTTPPTTAPPTTAPPTTAPPTSPPVSPP